MAQPAGNLLNEAPEPGPNLGVGFWAAWASGMAAVVATFVGGLVLFVLNDSPGGPIVGGAIVIAFTATLILLARLPYRERQKRGLEGHMREPYRRYTRRFLPAMFAYVVLLMAAVSYSNANEPTGVIAWLVAIAPAIPLIFAIRAIALLPQEEDDEYQRDRIYRSYAWATGATLMVCTTVGFLDMFDAIPHLDLWIVFPMWAVFQGLARCLPMGGAR